MLESVSGKNAWQSVDIHVDDFAFSCRKVCEEMELRWCIKPQDFLEILWIDISLELYRILQIMQATTEGQEQPQTVSLSYAVFLCTELLYVTAHIGVCKSM